MDIIIDRRALKREAKLSMRSRKPSIFGIMLVFLIIQLVLQLLTEKLQFPGLSFAEIAAAYGDDAAFLRLLNIAENRNFVSRLLETLLNLFTIVLSAGFTGACLNVSRNAPGGLGDLFDAFGIFFKVIWLNIVESVFIALWSLLLIVPGIIAAYRYSMAMFILLDDPDKGVMACIRESKTMTMGHKGELFVLDLSFIGWLLLSVIPFVSIYTIPFMTVAKANYYKVLSGRYTAPWTEEQPKPENF